MKGQKDKRIADFFFEIGTMRKLLRSHRQVLLTDDMSDNIASHSYRISMIGWILAKEEGVDPYKVVMMCLLHDIGEIRTGDHNYVHKRYVKEYEEDSAKEQLESLPFNDLYDLDTEYKERKTKEAKVAKDADLLDQILLLREYQWQGNKEAGVWLGGKGDEEGNVQYRNLSSETAKRIGKVLYDRKPSDWWNNIWTNKNK